ncbi:MAG: adenylate/guanylate cyclase domain-containing protein, partial [Candidatus Cloacimonetes bacterium]|nr:adenylate/guanylate cyclase domain-containing protein [Candidatus Cloacimonadota bacterium]
MKKIKVRLKFSRLYKKWYILLSFSLLLAFLLYLLNTSSFLREMELKLVDYRFRLVPIPERADSNVVIIAIDDGSLRYFRDNGISWPWPRDFYGYLVDYFTIGGAAAVLFDMQFYEPDIDREETYAEETDGAFADAIAANGNVFLGVQLSRDSLDTDRDLTAFSLPLQNPEANPGRPFHGLIAPLEIFLAGVNSIGVINVEPDRDGVLRRVPLIHPLHGLSLPQMAFSAWFNTRVAEKKIRFRQRTLQAGSRKIPIDAEGNYLINWYGSRGGESPFRYFSFQSVIAAASAHAYGRLPSIPPTVFRDKYIIIGATAAGLLDLKTNPYTKILPGMEIWATSLSNYLQGDFVRSVPSGIGFLLSWLIIFIIFYAITHLRALPGNLTLLMLLLLIVAYDFLLWKHFRILTDLGYHIIGFIVAYLLIVTISFLLEGKSRREIRKIFTRYLHPDVIRQLEEDPDQVQLGGEEINATVLYTDIYNFTTISEKKTPTELVEDLNRYFQKLTGMVMNSGGMLDKYTGDGIMALFGVPIARADHALLACEAAYAHKVLRRELAGKKDLTTDDKLHIMTRTGINSGRLVAGNIGSDKRMDYTAIG